MNLILQTGTTFGTLNFSVTTHDEVEVLNRPANGTDVTFLRILRILIYRQTKRTSRLARFKG